MKTKRNFRPGFGMGQIMAMLLVVLPMLAFIITLMIDYWSVMQEDYKLKLVANQISTILDGEQDLRRAGLINDLETSVSQTMCPNGINFTEPYDYNASTILVIIEHPHNGTYFKNKTLTTQMLTYSYHDQNISITGTCR